jgi:hypothetical protein
VENVRPRGEFRMRANIQLFITFQITLTIPKTVVGFSTPPIVRSVY